MRTLLRFTLLSYLLFSSCAFSQGSSEKEHQQQLEIEQLKAEIAKLNTDLNNLKSEVEQLHGLIAVPPYASFENIPTNDTSSTPQGPPPQKNETGYWCTKSNKRHNSSCRYYKTSDGYPCGPDDGTACKLCGG